MTVTSFFLTFLKPDHSPSVVQAPTRSADKNVCLRHRCSGIFLFACWLLLHSISGLQAQEAPVNADSLLTATTLPDTAVSRKPAQARVMLLTAEVAPWIVDRYIRQMDYARLTWKSTAYNLNPGNWAWDGDGFTTNQFGHPYHGSVFFNAYRSNGYSFWQSSAAVFAGSYLWETFAENQAPAPNDFINTGFGGIILGELAHRFARRIVSSRESGFRRQAAEVAGLLINPVNGFQRISRGAWAKNNTRDTTPVETELDAGFRRFRSNKNPYHFAMYGRIRFSYGDPFRQSTTPFDHFGILVEMGQDDSSLVNMVNIYGTLRSWRLKTAGQRSDHTLQLTANYDFINNSAFFYSAQSIRTQLLSVYRPGRRVVVQTQVGGGWIVLAAVPDPVMYKGRYYDYCMGPGYNAAVMVQAGKRLMAGVYYRGGYLRTVDGSAKDYFMHAFSAELRVSLLPGFFLCAEPGHFSLTGRYQHFPDLRRTYPYTRYSLRWNFTIR